MSNSLSVAVLQMTCGTDPQKNIERTVERIAAAVANGAKLVCLQEMFSIQYPCQQEDHRNFDFAEPFPEGETYQAMAHSAREFSVVIVAPLFERRAAGLYHNAIVVFDEDGSEVGLYRKMHIPDDPGYYEKFYFTPGDLGFQSVQTSVGCLGTCICWDQWFPEAARIAALKGAQLLVYPTAIGWLRDEKDEYGASQLDAWKTIIRSHAIANGVYVIAPNRVGIEGQIEFWGNSFVCDPNGNVIASASDADEETLIVDCDLTTIDVVRTHWPFLRDRRVDAYDDLLKRYVD